MRQFCFLKCPHKRKSDKTLGFSSGGDDYLAKPFSYNELISRSKALIRRYQVYKGKNESGNQSVNSASVNPTADPIASTSNASDSRHRILLFHDLEINQTVREVHKNWEAFRPYRNGILHVGTAGRKPPPDIFCPASF